MEASVMTFLRSWVLATAGFSLCACLFNIAVDPYMLFARPRIAHVNARKPAVDTQQRMMKAYDVLRVAPRTLILGSSRAALGIDALDPGWPEQDRPVYNLAFGAGTPYMAHRYLQHVLQRHAVSLVVLGLEFEYFLDRQAPVENDFEARLLVRRDGIPNAGAKEYVRDLFQGTFSLDALTDSMATLTANFRGDSSDLTAGNWYWGELHSLTVGWGSYSMVAMSDVLTAPRRHGSHVNMAAMADLNAILDLCRSRGARAVLFISPSYVDELEILDLANLWPSFEGWKRQLVALAARYSQAPPGTDVSLWDFSGYDTHSTETLAEGRQLQWFVNPDHYSRALGELIIRQISTTDAASLGVRLTPGNVESHLAEIRAQRATYHARRPDDVERIREFYWLSGARPASDPRTTIGSVDGGNSR